MEISVSTSYSITNYPTSLTDHLILCNGEIKLMQLVFIYFQVISEAFITKRILFFMFFICQMLPISMAKGRKSSIDIKKYLSRNKNIFIFTWAAAFLRSPKALMTGSGIRSDRMSPIGKFMTDRRV